MIDIERMKQDPVYFVEEILGLELEDKQRIALLFWSRKLNMAGLV